MNKVLATAMMISATGHVNQFDRGGKPYFLHCQKVAFYLKSDDYELMSIAYLHDIIEDTDMTYTRLRELGMTERVIEGVRCMTKVPGETNEEYLHRLESNIDAVRVKLADLRHNSDIRRLKGVTEKDIARMTKYHQMSMRLTLKLQEMTK